MALAMSAELLIIIVFQMGRAPTFEYTPDAVAPRQVPEDLAADSTYNPAAFSDQMYHISALKYLLHLAGACSTFVRVAIFSVGVGCILAVSLVLIPFFSNNVRTTVSGTTSQIVPWLLTRVFAGSVLRLDWVRPGELCRICGTFTAPFHQSLMLDWRPQVMFGNGLMLVLMVGHWMYLNWHPREVTGPAPKAKNK